MSKLSEIEPKQEQRLMDLVEAAGIDVSDWGNFRGGREYAARNPKYCYEWAFVHPKKFVILNIWHSAMREKGDLVTVDLNMREFAFRRNGVERRRSLDMDRAVQVALEDKLPIRVIVLGGRRRDINRAGEKASQVSKRLLDPICWTVTAYDWKTGAATLTRGSHRFVDQFSARTDDVPNNVPERRGIQGEVFVRSIAVRTNVLLRAGGKCEWCGAPGFATADGGIYLETHHVVPLGEGGPDVEKNVAALCPNHHREAHHGKNRIEMRQRLLTLVEKAASTRVPQRVSAATTTSNSPRMSE